MNNLARIPVLGLTLLAAVVLPLQVQADRKRLAGSGNEEFFIISSVDTQKGQLVLKRPTEVTVPMRIDGKTSYLSEQGKPLRLADLRAGDTVYVQSAQGSDGVPVALRIRRGPMTVKELHRRYLDFK